MCALLVRHWLSHSRMPWLTLTTTVRFFLLLNKKVSGELLVQLRLVL